MGDQIVGERNASPEISRAIARLKAGVLALIFAFIGGAGLFIATVWLVVEAGPRMGEHLNLLGHYFPGYRVSWPGAFAGLFYGALTGGIVGWAIGYVYNRIVTLRQR